MTKKIKVLMIITRLDRGGSADVFRELAENLDKEIFDIKLIAGLTVAPSFSIDDWKSRGILIYLPSLRRDINPVFDLYSLFKLYKIIRFENPDIVHTHTSKAGILGRIAAFLNRVPIIIHTPHGHIFYGYFGKFKTRLFIWFEKLAAKVTNRIITLTNIEKKDYISLGIGKEEKFSTIYCGINIDRFCKKDKEVLRKEFGFNLDNIIIGWIGRLEKIKGCEYFIRGCRIIKDKMKDKNIKFLLVGDGLLRPYLEELTGELKLSEDIIFMGNRDNIPEIMNIIDLFVLSSLNEGLGRVILEAMASGVPVVATRVGGVPEIVTDGITGLLIPPSNPEKIAWAVIEILNNKELYSKFSTNCRERAKLFSLDKMIKDTESLYLDEIFKNKL
jgi:glycosyltransferase involved in cell wall biosynthesis